MAWDRNTSAARIARFAAETPVGGIDVKRFDAAFEARRRRDIMAARLANPTERVPNLIERLGKNQAVVVDAVHVYCQLIDYGDLIGAGRDTEASHGRILGMLHLHYAGCDRLADEFEVQRVDFHGPRLHAVVITPAGDPRLRVMAALSFAETLKAIIDEASARVAGGLYRSRVRIGIESGQAVAINPGSGSEREPLFLGPAANLAAKLAEGRDEGIFLGDGARAILGGAAAFIGIRHPSVDQRKLLEAVLRGAEAEFGNGLRRVAAAPIVAELEQRIKTGEIAAEAAFRFHHREPPLKTLRFKDLMPSHSIRMPLACLFADVSGFTAYVQHCVSNGLVSEMVRTLHVTRSEMAATLRDDFGGRKVRFVGDCLHGLIAEGDEVRTDAMETVTAALHAAGGVRSSFELCQEMLRPSCGLGLAIGVEYGQTPISRLGIRGERSVRCAASRAVAVAEEIQSGLDGQETQLGPEALAHASLAIRRLFEDGPVTGLDYETIIEQIAPASVTYIGGTHHEERNHLG